MAIGKWNPFGQQIPVAPEDPVVKPLPIPCADGKQFGLENFGNTCYANSVLQALYFCSPFRELVIQHTDPYGALQSISPQLPAIVNPVSPSPTRRKPERKSTQDSANHNGIVHPPTPPVPSSPRTLFSALRSLYIHISQNPAEKGTVAPKAFIDKLKELNEAFRNTMHQDAHEFLNYLLNRIVEEMEEEKKQLHASGDDLPSSLRSSSSISHPPAMAGGTSSISSSSSPGATFIHQIFEGVLTSETRCLTCEKVSARDESFLDLSIDIEQNSSVTACLRQFSASEMLCQKNKFFCDGCCDLQEAEKRMKIKRLPNVLALHLKRFKYQEDVQRYIKLAYRVAFPFELRLFNTVDDAQNPDRLYELFAIVVHIGSGPNHGHYVSIIKTMGTWLVFDDETVDTIKESEIPKYFGESNAGSAYVLYYQAADLDLAALGLRAPPPPPSEPVEPPQHQEMLDPRLAVDSPDWLPQSIPAPPGLTTSPERIESPPPASPSISAQTPTIASSSERSPRKSPSQPLKINMSSPSPPSYPATVGPGSSPNTNSPIKSSIFNTIRHIPSLKVSHDSTGKPASSPVIAFPKEEHASSEPLPLLPPLNGTDKESEKKAGNWFRRKSLKGSGKPRPASEAGGQIPALPSDLSIGASSSPARFQTTGATSKHSKDLGSRRPSEPVLDRSAFPTPFTSRRPTTAGGLKHTSSQERSIRREPSSPVPLSSAVPVSSPHDFSGQTQLRPLPSIPASPQSSKIYQAQSPPSAYSRGSSEYGRPRRHPVTTRSFERSPSPPRLPARPSTAGGAISSGGSRTTGRSLPPPPPMPLNSGSHDEERDNGHVTLPQFDKGKTIARTEGFTKEEESSARPKSTHASAGLSIGAMAGANHSSSTNGSTVSSTVYSARRKMSFTAPLLGFGRKDKDRQKDKDKEREKKT
ncbi:cysteine proteinase [Leucogyrophana mollusca]|uniref:Cysteine proteinase n=1 Tax=Leucogyrophana mollusca TaxID=85980 RepID=A0ACB8BPI5_9AGAM|nr:cysteine proteinase [Leucogyrophana mollusca]